MSKMSEERSVVRKKNIGDFIKIIYILPDLITLYLQLFYNFVMVYLVLNSIFKFINILETDLNIYLDQKKGMAFSEIIRCSKEFLNNNCADTFVPPALEQLCEGWKICMSNEPNISTTKASVEIFADLINNFCNNLTDRTIMCILGMAIISIVLLNYSLSIIAKQPLNKKKHSL